MKQLAIFMDNLFCVRQVLLFCVSRIQEKDEQIKSMEESLQAAQASDSSNGMTIEVCVHSLSHSLSLSQNSS